MGELRKLPKLYSTDGRGSNAKIYRVRLYRQCGILPSDQFEWFLSEYDPNENVAFGYASLNDPLNSELGYVSIGELLGIGVKLDLDFKPLNLNEVKKKVGL
jgi:hypothetical protein